MPPSFRWSVQFRICPLCLLTGKRSRKEDSVFSELALADTLTDAVPAPARGWSDGVTLLPAAHWLILHPLLPWEVKSEFCLLVTFSPVGRRAGPGM